MQELNYRFVITGGKKGTATSPKFSEAAYLAIKKVSNDLPFWCQQPESADQSVYTLIRMGIGGARSLHEKLVIYCAKNSVPIWEKTFDRLIRFFLRQEGFPHRYQIIDAAVEENRRTNSIRFEHLPDLMKPTDEKTRSLLERHLSRYRVRLRKLKDLHPDISFKTSPVSRDALYKIAVLEALLLEDELRNKVAMIDLMNDQIDHHRILFVADELLSACGVISNYLGTPLFADAKTLRWVDTTH